MLSNKIVFLGLALVACGGCDMADSIRIKRMIRKGKTAPPPVQKWDTKLDMDDPSLVEVKSNKDPHLSDADLDAMVKCIEEMNDLDQLYWNGYYLYNIVGFEKRMVAISLQEAVKLTEQRITKDTKSRMKDRLQPCVTLLATLDFATWQKFKSKFTVRMLFLLFWRSFVGSFVLLRRSCRSFVCKDCGSELWPLKTHQESKGGQDGLAEWQRSQAALDILRKEGLSELYHHVDVSNFEDFVKRVMEDYKGLPQSLTSLSHWARLAVNVQKISSKVKSVLKKLQKVSASKWSSNLLPRNDSRQISSL